MNRIVIDVGASYGLFSNFIADRSVNSKAGDSIQVFALEPIPQVANKIRARSNLKIINAAILSSELIPLSGTRLLRVMQNSELSSFMELNAQLDRELWKSHESSLVEVSQIPVKCMTLEQVIRENSIGKVDFLKIDTQGTDLGVLLSAGKEISKIMSCVLEFPYTRHDAIYSNEKDISEAIETLGELGFYPIRIVPNGGGECNAFFLNSRFTIQEYFQMENELRFDQAPTLKIGKHNPLVNKTHVEKITYFLKNWIKRVIINLSGKIN